MSIFNMIAQGSGGGGEMETGTYTVSSNTPVSDLPIFEFTNTHTDPPAFVIVGAKGSVPTTSSATNIQYCRITYLPGFGIYPVNQSSSTANSCEIAYDIKGRTSYAPYIYTSFDIVTLNDYQYSYKYDATGFKLPGYASDIRIKSGTVLTWTAVWQ